MSPWDLAKSGSEDGHQAAIFAWANMAMKYGFKAADNEAAYRDKEIAEGLCFKNEPVLCMLHSTPNGGLRDKRTASRLKATGVKAGYPDISLDVPCGQYHGLRIELKKEGGRTSIEQKKWLIWLNERGYHAVVCFGWVETTQEIINYLSKKEIA